MKAILEFNLPEEDEEFYIANNGFNFSSVIEDLRDWVRNMAKYENKDTVKVEEVRSKIIELMEERNLRID